MFVAVSPADLQKRIDLLDIKRWCFGRLVFNVDTICRIVKDDALLTWLEKKACRVVWMSLRERTLTPRSSAGLVVDAERKDHELQ